jgi:hypothetical protein
MAIY